MYSGIYVKLPDGKFDLLKKVERFEREDDLQTLIEKHPALLGGEQISSDKPRRWLLIKRELGVPDSKTGGARWRVDLFFVDQDAIPTLVEVKLKENPEIRRKIIGQMLEYASHATAYFPVGHLRKEFEDACAGRGEDSARCIAELTASSDMDCDSFWERVANQLEAGRVRLIFVADCLPSEVKKTIEFLNLQMSPAEVLGVEIHHYAKGEIRALAPRVIGVSEETKQKKAMDSKSSKKWNEKLFFEALDSLPGIDESRVAGVRKLYAYVLDNGFPFVWGSGSTYGSIIVRSKSNHKTVFSIEGGSLYMYLTGLHGSEKLDAIRNGLHDYFEQNVGAKLGKGTNYTKCEAGWWNGVEQVIAKLREIESELQNIA